MKTETIIRDRLALACKVREAQSESGERYNFTSISEYLGYSDVTSFRRVLREGKIKADYLESIGQYLNVSPDFLSGKVDYKQGEEIPTYLFYLKIEKFKEWAGKHPIQDSIFTLIDMQGGDPSKYTPYQISRLVLRIVGIVNEFIRSEQKITADNDNVD
ncbi:MAG: hypothetical protein II918_02460 [Firmicutes bacterium]|nr:hypothetical protein [Bacillota bacterium]